MKLELWRRVALVALVLAVGCGGDGATSTGDDNANGDDVTDDDTGPTGSKDAGTKKDAGGGAKDAGKDTPPTKDAGPAASDDAGKPATGDGGSDSAPLDSIPKGPHTADGFVSLAPALGDALDPKKGTTVSPAAPAGWVWYEIPGAVCRDGSPTGFYVRFAESDSLLLYLEGGGACTSPDFCAYNPKNVNQVLNGSGETLLGSVGGAVAGRQQPGTDGIFNVGNAKNPFAKWSQIYVPYCTGDVHFGTNPNGAAPGVTGKQQYVGYRNMEKFMARIVPTFKDKAKRVVLTGASAGGFGTMLNFSLVQDSFGNDTWVTALNDSGPSFSDKLEPVCMQKRWRELWGYNAAFPKDCKECQQADGGGLGSLATFLQRKHPNFRFGIVSSLHDEVIRAFYAMGNDTCKNFDTASPVPAALGISFAAPNYEAGLLGIRSTYAPTNRYSSYYMSGFGKDTLHQHIWRPRFFEAASGGVTIAQWATDFLAGKMSQVGP